MIFIFIRVVRAPFYIAIRVLLLALNISWHLLSNGHEWYFYTLILLFVGGMMVAFVYASSVYSLFKIYEAPRYTSISVSFIIVILSTLFRFLYNSARPILLNPAGLPRRAYALISMSSMIFSILVLLIVLFTVVRITNPRQGPIKL